MENESEEKVNGQGTEQTDGNNGELGERNEGTGAGSGGTGGNGDSGKLDRSAEADHGDATADLLKRIKQRRKLPDSVGQSRPTGEAAGHDGDDVQGSVRENGSVLRGNENDTGTESGTNRKRKRRSGSRHNGSGSTRETSQSPEQQELNKPQGVKLGKLKGVPSLPKGVPAADAHPLSEKETKDLRPKMITIVQTIFHYMDIAIGATNRQHVDAYIWQTIDPGDCEVIADLVLEGGKKSRIVATSVRRLSMSYRMLQVGIITLPRFIQTFQHYQKNGGFALPFMNGGENNAQITNQRKAVPSREGSPRKKDFVAPAVKEG